MAITILDPTVAANVAAAVSQEAQRSALFAPFGSADVTVRALNGATLREAQTYGPWVFNTATPRGATLGNLIARTVSSTGAPTSFVFRAGSTDVFSMTGAVSPGTADIVLAAGIAVGPRTNLADGSVSRVTISANPALPVTSAVATAFTLSLSASSGTNGVAITVTVTPNGPIQTGGASVTLAASNGGVLGATSLSFTSGSTAAQTTTLTRSVAGTSSVTMTNNIGITNTGSGASFTSVAPPAGFSWTISDASTVSTGRNTTTQIATGVPIGATAYASPDLLPGQRLVLDGTTLNLVGDATVPTVDGSSSGSALDIVSARDVVIEVIEDPAIATIVNVTRGITYAVGADYTGRTSNQAANRWNAVMAEANVNDIIEVSPGAIHRAGVGDTANYWNGIDSTILAIWKPITLRGMAGRGRWWLYPNRDLSTSNPNGITIFAPNEIDSGRGAFTISDFDIDEWGNTSGSYGLRIRGNAGATDWAHYHPSLTVSNFKLGKPPYERSASGFEGSAETMLFENGHVYDTGGGLGGADGRDHNFYVSARTLTMRGVRAERTRGYSAAGWWEPGGADTDMDGHIAKLSFIDALIEGCAFISGPRSDNSAVIQAKAGGNLVMRGNIVIGGRYTQNQGQGMIVMLREATGGVPNYSTWWDAFRTGNSVLLERNVFINHYGRPILFFFTPDLTSIGAMLYGTGADQIASVSVRDNIGMVNNAVTADSPFTSTKWIKNLPSGLEGMQGAWEVRNTARAYSAGEFPFTDRELLMYGDKLGAPEAWVGGSMAIKQFVWPHHWRTVTRSTQGLG